MKSILLAFFFVGAAFGISVTRSCHPDVRNLKSEAVIRGAAEWVVDPATGDTEFQWKEKQP